MYWNNGPTTAGTKLPITACIVPIAPSVEPCLSPRVNFDAVPRKDGRSRAVTHPNPATEQDCITIQSSPKVPKHCEGSWSLLLISSIHPSVQYATVLVVISPQVQLKTTRD